MLVVVVHLNAPVSVSLYHNPSTSVPLDPGRLSHFASVLSSCAPDPPESRHRVLSLRFLFFESALTPPHPNLVEITPFPKSTSIHEVLKKHQPDADFFIPLGVGENTSKSARYWCVERRGCERVGRCGVVIVSSNAGVGFRGGAEGAETSGLSMTDLMWSGGRR